MIEREIKLRIQDPEAARALLQANGWTRTREPYAESNTLYDTPDGGLLHAGKMLRVRRVPGKVVLTAKLAPLAAGAHRAREEHEVEMAEAGGLDAISPRWGCSRPGAMRSAARFEKPGEAD